MSHIGKSHRFRVFPVDSLPVTVLCVVAGFFAVLSRSGGASGAEPSAITPEQEQFFEQQVRPLLAAHCFECHGAKKQEAALRLDSRAGVLRGGDSAEPAAVAGDPDKSKLIAAVRYDDDLQMPPDKRLSDEQIAVLVSWVTMGLPWPVSADAPPMLSDEEARRVARESHWAYQPIARPPLPSVHDVAWPQTGVDHFVLAKLEERGLVPNDAADRRTLIRRATYDLLGLPPDAGDVDAFADDPAPDAYERMIDRLLASPRYGERWGRHWLDVARYADTSGYAFNRDRRYPYSYTYRDYVIRSLNEDKPYDRFVTEQLAADLIDLGEDNRSLAALGLLTVGRKFNNRHDDLDDQIDVVSRGLMGLTVGCARCHDHKYDPIPIADYYSLYGVFASSNEPGDLPLIGVPEETPGYDQFKQKLDELTAQREAYLAKQHDQLLDRSRRHTVDYLVRVVTSLTDEELAKLPFVTLNSDDLKRPLVDRWRRLVREQARPDDPLLGPLVELSNLPDEAYAEKSAEVIARWTSRDAGASPGQINARIKERFRSSPPASKTDVAKMYGELFSEAYTAVREKGDDVAAARAAIDASLQPLAAALFDPGTPTDIPLAEVQQYFNRAERDQFTKLQTQIDSHEVNSPGAPPRAMIVREQPQPHDPRIFLRGNPARQGDRVPRQFLYVVAGEARRPFEQSSGRLELARAIVAEDNPLTRRVLVNRVWMHHFGQPLVDTPSDFGVRCERPVHAELLDHLATKLADDGWSLKRLHREILLSATYRQSSADRESARAADPENRLFWKMNRRRLEFEALRDSLLVVAGALDTTAYGKPVVMTDRPFPRRRSVYGFIDRQDLPNLLRVFDFASPDQSSPERPQTTVPQQALFMMNSPFVIQQTQRAASRPEFNSESLVADPASRVAALYREFFGRQPTPEELAIAVGFLSALPTEGPPPTEAAGGDKAGAAADVSSPRAKLTPWEQFVQLVMLTNEFAFVD